jgi:hypothetical protein
MLPNSNLHGYTEATKAEAQEMKRVVEEDRKALEQEKAAMEKTRFSDEQDTPGGAVQVECS